MNIHPLVVHFPIACLILYSMIELLCCFLHPTKAQWRETTKLFLLFVGVGGTFAALQTGEMAEHLMGRSALIKIHSTFGQASHNVYAVLVIYYLLHLGRIQQLITTYIPSIFSSPVLTLIHWLEKQRWTKWVVALLALIGIALLTITGALGGAITYGPDVDPVVRILYDLFVGQ